MLHHTQTAKLAKDNLELFKEKGKEAVLEALPKEWNGRELDDEDRRDIVNLLESGSIKADPPKEPAHVPDTSVGNIKRAPEANKDIDLSAFDYSNLTDDAWKKYKQLEASLIRRQPYYFAVYTVEPIRKERYPGLRGSPIDVVGIKLRKDKPARVLKLEASAALILNEQLPGANARNPMEYYLLAK